MEFIWLIFWNTPLAHKSMGKRKNKCKKSVNKRKKPLFLSVHGVLYGVLLSISMVFFLPFLTHHQFWHLTVFLSSFVVNVKVLMVRTLESREY